jgi:uncharacterized membrane protein YdbT with pleckstrin-like domain
MEEKTIWSGTSSQLVNLGRYMLSLLVLLLLLLVTVWLWPKITNWGTLAIVVSVVLLLLPLLYALGQWLRVISIHYELTTERIKLVTGILSKKTDTMELYRVKDFTLFEPFFYRLFKLGNILITTSDQTTPRLSLPAIRGARKLLDELRRSVEARRDLKGVREMDFDQVAPSR